MKIALGKFTISLHFPVHQIEEVYAGLPFNPFNACLFLTLPLIETRRCLQTPLLFFPETDVFRREIPYDFSKY